MSTGVYLLQVFNRWGLQKNSTLVSITGIGRVYAAINMKAVSVRISPNVQSKLTVEICVRFVDNLTSE